MSVTHPLRFGHNENHSLCSFVKGIIDSDYFKFESNLKKELQFTLIFGHGRLIKPVSRASMWRFGYDTPHDYTDNQGFCGGRTVKQSLPVPVSGQPHLFRFSSTNMMKPGDVVESAAIHMFKMDLPENMKLPDLLPTGSLLKLLLPVISLKLSLTLPLTIGDTSNSGFAPMTTLMKIRNRPVLTSKSQFHRFFYFHDISLFSNVLEVYPEMGNIFDLPKEGNKNYTAYVKLPDGMTCSQCIFQVINTKQFHDRKCN